MARTRQAVLAISCVVALFAARCGDEDGDKGAPPIIENLVYTAPVLPLGQQTTITGSIDFQDPEGDVEIMEIDLTMPSGQTASVPDTRPSGVAGVEQGTIHWSLIIQPVEAGTHQFTLRLVDGQGNVGNGLTGEFEAQ